ncbi:MAG: hypothetical protein AAGF12_05330 [Myxococcota bacterium]
MSSRPHSKHCPHAVDASLYNGDLPEFVARAWGVSADASVAALRRAMSSTHDVDRKLSELPAAALLALEIVVESGGLLLCDELGLLLHRRTGIPLRFCESLCMILTGRGLLIRVAPVQGSYNRSSYAVHAEHADQLWTAIMGLSRSSEDPPTGLDEGVADPELSPLVAIAGATLHHKLRVNMDNTPNHSSVKTFARHITESPERVRKMLLDAHGLGLLRRGGDAYQPLSVEDLFDTCREPLASADHREYRPLLANGPVEEDWLIRLIARGTHLRFADLFGNHSMLESLQDAEELVKGWTTLQRSSANGHVWVALAKAPPLPKEPVEGFVTPNLEVIVGPEPDPRIVARVALAAELTRIDRVLTFKLRPETVSRAVGHGLAIESLIEALTLIGKHPLPPALHGQVVDWGTPPAAVRAEPVTLLHVPKDRLAEVQSRLGNWVVARTTDGELLVRGGKKLRELEKKLSSLNVEVEGSVAGAAVDASRTDERSAPRPPVIPELPGTGDPALRRLVDADRKADFATSLAPLAAEESHDSMNDPGEVRRAIREAARAADPPKAIMRGVECLLRVHESLEESLLAWAGSEFRSLVSDPIAVLPLLAIAPSHRKRILERPVSEKAFEDAFAWMQKKKLSPEGRKIIRLIHHPILDHLTMQYAPFAEQSEKEVKSALVSAVRNQATVEVWQAVGENMVGSRVVRTESLQGLGDQVTIFATDVDSDQSIAIALDDILAVHPVDH